MTESRPRLPFLLALLAAGAAWWLAGEPRGPAPALAAAAAPVRADVTDSLRAGQTLGGLWEAHDLAGADLAAVDKAGAALVNWRSLRAGAVYTLQFAPDGALRGFDLVLDRDRRLTLWRQGTAFRGQLVETRFTRRGRAVSVCVEGSPWATLEAAGEDPSLVVGMAEVFAAQVDFHNDIHAGDCFAFAFTVDERPDGSYRLVQLDAVRLAVGDTLREAYRFAVDGGPPDWYDETGTSLKRRFLRSPLKFTRISSGFGMRMHPVLRRARRHDGVDYVAPAGTPVQASGDGVVQQAGRNGGHGLYIKLQHGRDYATSYSHLSRIAPRVHPGAQVAQGEVIGYVGSTGLSTGAHLDYRFMKDGRYVDPLSTDLPTAIPLEGPTLAAFAAARDAVRQRFDVAGGRLETPGGMVPSGS
ncbi:MAG: peptidoglycan DD-metalloendopeptidase family protein [Gemmatimonadota bacterium]